MKLRLLEILKEKGKSKYWLYIQMGLSYQNFNKLVNNQTNGIKKRFTKYLNARQTTYLKNIISP